MCSWVRVPVCVCVMCYMQYITVETIHEEGIKGAARPDFNNSFYYLGYSMGFVLETYDIFKIFI